MQIRKRIFYMVVLSLALPAAVSAQSSSINTFSPYTLYGLGDFTTQGPAFIRSMGGAGVAFRSYNAINYLNPASYSAIGQKSFLFNFGMEGANYYLKGPGKDGQPAKSSYNTFNVRDIALEFPIAKKIGFGISVTPLSNVGYRIEKAEDDPSIVANLGQVKYKYSGEGSVTQFKAGLGIEVVKNLSLGAEMVYYLGSINRYFGTYITPITGPGVYGNMEGSQKESVSRLFANFGLQYNAIYNTKRLLTIGATYQPSGKLNADVSRYIPSGDMYGDTVSLNNYTSNLTLPANLTLGVFYQTNKIGLGADYTFQNWAGRNGDSPADDVRFTDTHSIKLGVQYTPDRGDIRRFYNRWTYRFGVRYNTYYMKMKGQDINDKALTVGLGIPIRMAGMSNINLGAEVGQRGTTNAGLIKDTYFKFSIGLSLFGEDFWFMKQKYD